MKIYIIFVLSLTILFSCDPNNSGKLPPPQQVQMVEKLTDLSEIERGIDTVPDRDGIYIEWYLLADPDVTSYNIYRKLKSETIFSKIATIPVENVISPFDSTFSYIDDDNIVLDNSQNVYYYYVTATNRDGVEGSAPDSLTENHYLLYSKPQTENHPDINAQDQPVFRWRFQGIIPDNYIIRIENQVTENLIWIRKIRIVDYVPDQTKDLSTIANPPEFQPQSIYRWRIDTVGPDSLFSGSESNWKSFLVN